MAKVQLSLMNPQNSVARGILISTFLQLRKLRLRECK